MPARYLAVVEELKLRGYREPELSVCPCLLGIDESSNTQEAAISTAGAFTTSNGYATSIVV